jgi:hypothetical protein
VKHLLGIASIVLGAAFAEAGPDRQQLIGTWQSQGGESQTWKLAAKGEAMQIVRAENDRKVSEVECNTAGRECALKDEGKPVKVSMWFNGSKLVVMETRGSEVLKRRFQASGDGSTMELETIPIKPQGKPETVRLTRAPASQ